MHNIIFKIRYEKKQKIWPIVKRKRVNRNWPQDDHMLQLADKDFKEGTINISEELKDLYT